jgi:hypothetical protein
VTTNNDKSSYRLSATGVDDIWDEATSGHTTAGTTGKALIDAGSAGDPWSTALPGSYASGTAGYIVGTNLDASVSSRSTYAGGAVASVTGNVGGDVVGSVASVTADVGITQTGADKVWSTSTRALTDKIGFALSSAGVQAIWDALTSALTTVGSIGKLLVTNIDAAISSRSTYAGGAVASVTAGVIVTTNNDKTGYRLSSTGVDDVWDEATSGHTTAGTTGPSFN